MGDFRWGNVKLQLTSTGMFRKSVSPVLMVAFGKVMDDRNVSLTHGKSLWVCRDGAAALERIMNIAAVQPKIARACCPISNTPSGC